MKFKPMGVDVAGWNFGLDKLNRELDRHQFIRELTQNSIEAVGQTENGVGDVVWELYPLEVQGETVNKLCCIDSGVGMTGPELVEYINTGFKSGKQRGHQGNFGIGAKVSALTFNKAGVLYMSWKNGEGAMIHLAQDEKTGFYGLNQLERPDGTFGWWSPIGNKDKPGQIGDHGTVVVLLGDTDDEDTFERPEGSSLPVSRWVITYLQRKYLHFPHGITVRARRQAEDSAEGRSKYGRPILIVRGQRTLLEKESETYGTVELEGVRFHYWLLRKKAKSEHDGNPITSASAHIAALYKNELHEVRYGTHGAYQRLASFGITVGQNRVVIYVEPDRELVEANLTRQHLLVNGERFPWDYYASLFSENIPEPIKKMMNDLLDAADARSNMDKITERLKELDRLLSKVNRYRPSENGDVNADTPTLGGSPSNKGREEEDKNPSGGDGGLKSHIYRLIKTAAGEKAKRKKVKPKQPEVVWVTLKNGTRVPGFLEERAAMYDPNANRITANLDFDNFQKVVKAIKLAIPQANGAGESAAMLEFETVLVETVMNILAREGSQHWSDEELKSQYAAEALTNCVNHTFHIVNAAKAEVALQKKKANQLAKAPDEEKVPNLRAL